MKRLFIAFGLTAVLAMLATGLWLYTPDRAPFDRSVAKARAENYRVRLIRDEFGTPHLYGDRNIDVAFGLAYAHASDDWATFEEVIRFSRGALAETEGKSAAVTDYLIAAIGVEQAIRDRIAPDLSPDTRAILAAYADGVNFYCAEAPGRCARDVVPVSMEDIVAGFVARTPFFYGLDETLTDLFSEDGAGAKTAAQDFGETYFRVAGGGEFGSNAMALAPNRAADGHTRLLVNSHQPFTGPVAWYEARLKSAEGWDIIGGLFPGSPFVLHGARPELGWAFTVNKPDLVDVYALEVDDENKPERYLFEGAWRAFETSKANFRVKLFGPFSLPVRRTLYRSVHGPAFKTPRGWAAVAFAGDRDIRAVEQWRRMNFATNFETWRAAFELQGIPSFNVVYADRTGSIAYFYNAAIPVRSPEYDWSGTAPGDAAAALWSGVRPFGSVPGIVNPPSGFVANANNSPFEAAAAPDAPDSAAYPPHYGIDRRTTNRGARIQELYFVDESITGEEFIEYKMDDLYSEDSRLVRMVRSLIADRSLAADPELATAVALLEAWDRSADRASRGAALAILTGQRALGFTLGGDAVGVLPPVEALRETARRLMSDFGRLDPLWGEVSRLRRGAVDLPVDGGPDALRANYGLDGERDGALRAAFGDTYIMAVDWAPDGAQTIRTIHQFGAATLDAASPHYADQAPLFAEKQWKTPPMQLEALLEQAEMVRWLGQGAGPQEDAR